jgi:uncharacterized protein
VPLTRHRYEYDGPGMESRDVGSLFELFSPDVVHRYPGANQLSDEHRGRDALLAFYGRFIELTAGTLRVDPLEVRAEAPNTVVTTHRTVDDRPDGWHIDTTARLVITIADGRILNIDEESAEPDRVDGVWA